METKILFNLIEQRLGAVPPKFTLHGQEVVFFDPDMNNKTFDAPNESPYDTPENRAIVEDVIKNYDTLATEYEDTAKSEVEAESLIQAKILEQAITALKAEGKLTVDGKVVR